MIVPLPNVGLVAWAVQVGVYEVQAVLSTTAPFIEPVNEPVIEVAFKDPVNP